MSEKTRRTTWNDYHSENVEKKEFECGRYISEPHRSRFKVSCPFCHDRTEIYAWSGYKRCICGAMLCIRPNVAFRIKEINK